MFVWLYLVIVFVVFTFAGIAAATGLNERGETDT
jgi:hypothetical protein